MADVTGSQGVAITEIEVEDSPGSTVVVVSGIVPAIALVGIFAIVMLVLRTRLWRGEPDALELLGRRLARGEITTDQYREIRALLTDTDAIAPALPAADPTELPPAPPRTNPRRRRTTPPSG